jgi:hypothetical protein
LGEAFNVFKLVAAALVVAGLVVNVLGSRVDLKRRRLV